MAAALAVAAGAATGFVLGRATGRRPSAGPAEAPAAAVGADKADKVVIPHPPPAPAVKGKYTLEEVKKHNTEDDAWMVYGGRVYDVTNFVEPHPGGKTSILINLDGADTTEEFNAIHSKKAVKMLEDYLIGDLVEGGGGVAAAAAAPAPGPVAADGAALVALDPRRKVSLRLVKRTQKSHNTVVLRFALPSPGHRLGLPVGQHFLCYGKDKAGGAVIRAYTPLTGDEVAGHVDLLIKVYYPAPPRFPEGGRMSQYLDDLRIGQTLDVKGPLGEFEYLGRGDFTVHGKPGPKLKQLSMIAGGTGITPCWQLIQYILEIEKDPTVALRLLFANQAEEDILLRDELDALAARHPNFAVAYTLDRPPPQWKHSSGFITHEMCQEALFRPAEGTLCVICGPPVMVDRACVPNLTKMGYRDDQIFVF